MQYEKQEVKDFFDDVAGEYGEKYKTHPLLSYFFNQRLEFAFSQIDKLQGKLLDIGAGNGVLYDRINQVDNKIQYLGIDISPEMLENSSIPIQQRIVGSFLDLSMNSKEYDYVFMLGVTTYLDKMTLDEHMTKIYQILKPKGKLIISFTNKLSLDTKLREILKPPIRLVSKNKNVISQNFKIRSYKEKELEKTIFIAWSIIDKKYLNQTIFPLNRLFPKVAIKIGSYLYSNHRASKFISLFSSDILYTLRPKNGEDQTKIQSV